MRLSLLLTACPHLLVRAGPKSWSSRQRCLRDLLLPFIQGGGPGAAPLPHGWSPPQQLQRQDSSLQIPSNPVTELKATAGAMGARTAILSQYQRAMFAVCMRISLCHTASSSCGCLGSCWMRLCARCIYKHRPHKLYTHLCLCLRAAQHCCFHAPGCQCCNLVLHQRDKGRHNNTRPACKHSSGNQCQTVGLQPPVGTHTRHKGPLACWQVHVSVGHTLLLCRVDIGGVTGSCCH